MFLLITITAYSDEMNTISQNNKRSQNKKNKRDRLEMIKLQVYHIKLIQNIHIQFVMHQSTLINYASGEAEKDS